MDIARNINVDFTVMKEPRGFLRVIQFVLAILAFATICTSATATINIHCLNSKTTQTVSLTYSYPFRLSNVAVDTPFCNTTSTITTYPLKALSFAAAAQFFCFIGVMSFLLCIAYVVGYVVFSPLFQNGERGATIDFVFSIVWSIMWFIASTAWADRLNSMGTYLDPYKIIRDDLGVLCTQNGKQICTAGEAGSHATLVVSVLFGYLNMLIWIAGLWFLYKETRWHKEQSGDMSGFDTPQAAQTPPGETGGAGPGGYQSPDPPSTY